jgi:hypothetical protein
MNVVKDSFEKAKNGDKVRLSGNPEGPHSVTLVQHTTKAVVFKRAGYSYWYSRQGDRGYAGAEYIVCQPKPKANITYYSFDVITEFPVTQSTQ